MHSTHYIEANTFLRLGPAIQWVGAYPDRLASESEPNTMFSPREIDNDQFIYGCHACGWESDVMTTEEAISCSRSHKCWSRVDFEQSANERAVSS
jgi:hypothetical protein